MASKEYKMAIKIAGEIEKSFYNSTKLTKKELAAIAKQARATSSTFSESFSRGLKDAAPAFNGIENAGKSAFKAITIAATAAATAATAVIATSISAGQKFESAFAGVKKTTEATAAEYEDLRNGILAMSERLPASASQIAEVAEAAGQLGIKKENLLDFTQVMIDLGESTNMTSTDAASALAKFANITNMSADNYSNLGSVIVDLGNNFATTESDIVSMATRLAASGELAGLSKSEIMALSAAMSSVGLEAEAGGSAMSKLLKNIQVSTELGGESLQKYASVAGMTGEEFKKAFGESALSATSAFISGLNDTERNGKSAIAILDDMGLTEVRLSNTILSLANAKGVMTDAITTANEAWEENVALTNEASQRYATAESQVEMLKNKVTNVGIGIYDDIRESYTDVISLVSDVVSKTGDMIEDSGIFKNMAESFSKGLPTAARELKQFGSAISDFSQPFLTVGNWLIHNPGVIVGAIVSLGSALTMYKIANKIMAIKNALMSLNPIGLSIMAIAGVVGVIAGIGAAVKKSATEAKKANLAAHFGNIALSMKEINKIASSIVSSGSLTRVRRSLEEFEKLEGIQDTINELSNDIDKSHWELSIGIDMSKEDAEIYKKNIASYVEQCQEFVDQKQYAVNLAVGVLADNDLNRDNMISQINDFYAGKKSELAELGKELNEAITDAFQDGLLDIDETKNIAEIRASMSKIQAELSQDTLRNKMNAWVLDNGPVVDADSYLNMQQAFGEYLAEAKADFTSAYVDSLNEQDQMLRDGAISQSEYDVNTESLRRGYQSKTGSLEAEVANTQLNAIMGAYSDEIAAAEPQIQQMIDDMMTSVGFDSSLQYWVGLNDEIKYSGVLAKDTRAALTELYDQATPSIELAKDTAKQILDSGDMVPANLMDAINKYDMIGAMIGKEDSIMAYTGKQISDNEGYQAMFDSLGENMGKMPDGVAAAIEANQHVTTKAAENLYKETEQALDNSFEPGFDMFPIVRIKMQPDVSNVGFGVAGALAAQNGAAGTQKATLGQIMKSGLGGHKDGGIFDVPHVAWFAEDGPEATIPLDGSQNAISLWEETGKLLGLTETGNDSVPYNQPLSSLAKSMESAPMTQGGNINYAPTLQFNGESPSRKDLDEALEMSEERFASMMERYMSRNARLRFS
ncbi:MAG: phage tail tape measure protein [Roseburia sp.]